MVTVYIPAKNGAKYIRFAIDSVLVQTMQDFEVILIDDGSTDGTFDIMQEYTWDKRFRQIRFEESKGLPYCANTALKLAQRKYIVRLDCDDMFDENALLVMTSLLDRRSHVGLVYPDYYKIDSEGRVGEIVRREKIDQEWHVYDKAPHGACTMFRTDVLRQLEGYDTGFTCQDGLAMWLKFIDRYNPYNINIPLFYYRKHGVSLSYDVSNVAKERTKIKKEKVDNTKVLGVIMAAQKSIYPKSGALELLNDRPLIDYTIDAAKESCLEHLVVSTPDLAVQEYVAGEKQVTVYERPPQDNYFMDPSVVALHALDRYSGEVAGLDTVCVLYANVPLRKAHHIDEAIYTKYIFGFDSLITVDEDYSFFYAKGNDGLIPMGRSNRQIRIDREVLYKENGAVYVVSKYILESGMLVGGRVGYTVMPPAESVKINSEYEHWLAEQSIRRDNVPTNRTRGI
jgi:glycosyltransferase involved in cell wall biosynthesis